MSVNFPFLCRTQDMHSFKSPPPLSHPRSLHLGKMVQAQSESIFLLYASMGVDRMVGRRTGFPGLEERPVSGAVAGVRRCSGGAAAPGGAQPGAGTAAGHPAGHA